MYSFCLNLCLLSFLPGLFQSNQAAHAHPAVHAFYLSVIEIAYPVEDGRTSLRVKVFSNDLQNAVSEFHHLDALIGIDAMCQESDELIVTYLENHIFLELDGKKVKSQLRECRQEGDSHWLTFDIDRRPWKQISLRADFFMELFPTQTQIVNVQHAGTKRFARLTKAKPLAEFEFK